MQTPARVKGHPLREVLNAGMHRVARRQRVRNFHSLHIAGVTTPTRLQKREDQGCGNKPDEKAESEVCFFHREGRYMEGR